MFLTLTDKLINLIQQNATLWFYFSILFWRKNLPGFTAHTRYIQHQSSLNGSNVIYFLPLPLLQQRCCMTFHSRAKHCGSVALPPSSMNRLDQPVIPEGRCWCWQAALRADKKQVSFFSADQLLRQQARKPPSTGRVTPFVMLLLSLSRNKMLFTTSSTSAGADRLTVRRWNQTIKAMWCGYTFISTCSYSDNYSYKPVKKNDGVKTNPIGWNHFHNKSLWPAKRPRGMREVMVLAFSGSLQPIRPISVITTVGFTAFTLIWSQPLHLSQTLALIVTY